MDVAVRSDRDRVLTKTPPKGGVFCWLLTSGDGGASDDDASGDDASPSGGGANGDASADANDRGGANDHARDASALAQA
jgi:hypothetical protein